MRPGQTPTTHSSAKIETLIKLQLEHSIVAQQSVLAYDRKKEKHVIVCMCMFYIAVAQTSVFQRCATDNLYTNTRTPIV